MAKGLSTPDNHNHVLVELPIPDLFPFCCSSTKCLHSSGKALNQIQIRSVTVGINAHSATRALVTSGKEAWGAVDNIFHLQGVQWGVFKGLHARKQLSNLTICVISSSSDEHYSVSPKKKALDTYYYFRQVQKQVIFRTVLKHFIMTNTW